MSISERYRETIGDVRGFLDILKGQGATEDSVELRQVVKAVENLAELEELVGEIPRIRLESQLTPVLLKAHGDLDRARLLLEEKGEEDLAARAWGLEQKLYRLLNDL